MMVIKDYKLFPNEYCSEKDISAIVAFIEKVINADCNSANDRRVEMLELVEQTKDYMLFQSIVDDRPYIVEMLNRAGNPNRVSSRFNDFFNNDMISIIFSDEDLPAPLNIIEIKNGKSIKKIYTILVKTSY